MLASIANPVAFRGKGRESSSAIKYPAFALG